LVVHEDAEMLAVGFRLGLVQQSEIVAWADARILELDDPPIEVIDLACMRKAHAQDIVGKLRELTSGKPPLQVLPAALERYTVRLREDPNLGPVVANGLWDLAVEAQYRVPVEWSAVFGFDEDYWLARNGSGITEADVFADLLSFCERFERAP
jgi:hypothetical protein